MINIFEKDDCYIITLIPQTEEEAEYLLKGQKLLSREEEIREQELLAEKTVEKQDSEDNEKADSDYEQILLNL